MKDRQTSSATETPPIIPQLHQAHHQHHHHRFVRKQRADDETWRDLPARGADINLLANSLTSRLRRAARQKVAASNVPTSNVVSLAAARLAAEYDDDEDSSDERKTGRSKRKGSRSQPQARPSILKKSASNEAADKYPSSPDESLKSSSPLSDHHLPNVFSDRRLSSSTGQLDRVGTRPEHGQRFPGKRSTTMAQVTNGAGAGSQGRALSSSGPVQFVKRAGIFLPADKYAQGRQTLHGEDTPFARNVPVDYETVTIPSRLGTPDSESMSVGSWSGKSVKKKGLKVSWKNPDVSDTAVEQTDARTEEPSSPLRLRSAGTAQSDASYGFSKPRFNSGKSGVPSIGIRWKVPVPSVKGASRASSNTTAAAGGGGGGGGEGGRTSHLQDTPRQASALFEIPSPAVQQQQNSNPKPSATRDPQHPWRAVYHSVHPVTTAMEREGTSVSKTMWHVPTRKVHAYTFIEDLLESKSQQWRPPLYYRMRTNPMGASTPNRSIQVRYSDNPSSSNDTSMLLSNGLENDQGDSCRSY